MSSTFSTSFSVLSVLSLAVSVIHWYHSGGVTVLQNESSGETELTVVDNGVPILLKIRNK